MVIPVASFVLLLVSVIVQDTSASVPSLKLGFIFPNCTDGRDSTIDQQMGFCSSASAVTIALDRVRREQLLPAGVKLKLLWRYDSCDESQATAVAIDLYKNHRVDVIFGPPCTLASEAVSVISKLYNKPLISWAAPNGRETPRERLNIRARMTGSGRELASALQNLLLTFDWTRIALFYTYFDPNSRCKSIVPSALKYFEEEERIEVVTMYAGSNAQPSDDEVRDFLEEARKETKIILICNDKEEYDHAFFEHALRHKMVGHDFVYIIPDFLGDGANSTAWTPFRNRTDWMKLQSSLLFLHLSIGSSEQLQQFKHEVAQRMREWPFVQPVDNNISMGSHYSPFLYDAVYLYALSLNKTLANGMVKPNGVDFVKAVAGLEFQGSVEEIRSHRTFFDAVELKETPGLQVNQNLGMSGYVSMDKNAVRRPTYVVQIFDIDGMNTKPIMLISTHHKENPISFLVSKDRIWDSRSAGHKPTWKPTAAPETTCGSSGVPCQSEPSKAAHKRTWINWIVTSVTIACVLLVCWCARCLTNARICTSCPKKKPISAIKWKILNFEMEKLIEASGYGSKMTINTEVSNFSGALARNDQRIVIYRGQLCFAKRHRVSTTENSKALQVQMRNLLEIKCENLNQFVGLCLDDIVATSVWKFCLKGNLQELLLNTSINLDGYIKHSFIRDLVNGMDYLRNDTPFKSHGYLKPSNCLINERWTLKITDYGLTNFRTYGDLTHANDRVYTSPELLRNEFPPLAGTQAGDVYSFAIILSEIVTREVAFSSYGKAAEEILFLVRTSIQPPFRPELPNPRDIDVDPRIVQLMIECWSEDVAARPSFESIKTSLRQMKIQRDVSLLDHAIRMTEKYANGLETQIKEKTRQLADEAKKADIILYKLLPRPIANRLKAGELIQAESYENVTVIFSDIAEFESIAAKSTPYELISLLNDIYYELDEIIEDHEAYKIQTVNDVYMLATGLPLDKEFAPIPLGMQQQQLSTADDDHHRRKEEISSNHAGIAANLAVQFQIVMSSFVIPHLPKQQFQMRIGMHTGSIAAGVVGKATPRYCLFGDTVNVANLLLEHSKPSCIHISQSTRDKLESLGEYVLKPRGDIETKQLGSIATYWLLGQRAQCIMDATEQVTSNEGSYVSSEASSIAPSSARVRAWD